MLRVAEEIERGWMKAARAAKERETLWRGYLAWRESGEKEGRPEGEGSGRRKEDWDRGFYSGVKLVAGAWRVTVVENGKAGGKNRRGRKAMARVGTPTT